MQITIDQSLDYRIPGEILFFSRERGPTLSNAVVQSWPVYRPGRCLVSRLIHGRYFLSGASPQAANASASLKASNGESFTIIVLEPGEQCCFLMGSLVAIQERLLIATRFNFSFAAAAVGHSFISTATGPGLFVLSCYGLPSIITSRDSTNGFPASRMIAWSPDVVFAFGGIPSALDVVLSEVVLRNDRVPAKCMVLLNSLSSAPGNFVIKAIKEAYRV